MHSYNSGMFWQCLKKEVVFIKHTSSMSMIYGVKYIFTNVMEINMLTKY